MKFLPGPHQTLFSHWEKLKLFIAHMTENHRKDWNPADPRDFIDAYLKEIEKVREPKLFLCSSRAQGGALASHCCNKLPQAWGLQTHTFILRQFWRSEI